jgi:hypothetical protein
LDVIQPPILQHAHYLSIEKRVSLKYLRSAVKGPTRAKGGEFLEEFGFTPLAAGSSLHDPPFSDSARAKFRD